MNLFIAWIFGYIISYFMQNLILRMVSSSQIPFFKSPNYTVNLISDEHCLSKIKGGYLLISGILAVLTSFFFILTIKEFDIYSDVGNLVVGFCITSFATVHLILSALLLKIKIQYFKKEIILIVSSVFLSLGCLVIMVFGFLHELSL